LSKGSRHDKTEGRLNCLVFPGYSNYSTSPCLVSLILHDPLHIINKSQVIPPNLLPPPPLPPYRRCTAAPPLSSHLHLLLLLFTPAQPSAIQQPTPVDNQNLLLLAQKYQYLIQPLLSSYSAQQSASLGCLPCSFVPRQPATYTRNPNAPLHGITVRSAETTASIGDILYYESPTPSSRYIFCALRPARHRHSL
jgi:hypothetical protein